MITVETALEQLFALVSPGAVEELPLAEAAGRVLARPVSTSLTQPPFAASAMDGYAVAATRVAPGARFRVIGEAAAGHGFDGIVAEDYAVRIFTGAPLPTGTDHVIIQEDVSRDGDMITLGDHFDEAAYVRPAGADFSAGMELAAPRPLGPSEIALLAAMNISRVPVRARPRVALLATGDELVMPGETPGPDQIIASNSFGLKALVERLGATAQLLPIARDNEASLRMAFELAQDADLIVTIGGASVGDHDLVGPVAEAMGLNRSFYKIAMRPGKPLMAGRIGQVAMIGLPGNPVSAMVCGHVFLAPVIRAMLGLAPEAAPRGQARLGVDIAANGKREHYMRAVLDGEVITPQPRQDSALLSVLAASNALLIRPIEDGPRKAGDIVDYIPL
ncbi:gephyrin-like molybdotransferase Glp [Roseovarius sp. C7]|uniref:molybdopterin molybdotransferase MoeA n=1 Tax=Roseovarius sp. C7 TaxID=3398643 RepID=UPI0039F54C61